MSKLDPASMWRAEEAPSLSFHPNRRAATLRPYFNVLMFSGLISLLLVFTAGAQAQPASPLPFRISGFVDGYYAWSSNAPDNHESFFPGTGTTAKRANELALNLAAIELSRDAAPAGFKLSFIAGNGATVVHAGEPGDGPETYRHIYEASVTYKATDKLTLKAGIFPSHIGMEGFFSKDNWNYTRSWLGELSPYYQTGIHAAYELNERWSGEVHVLNGWQNIGDNNDAKAIGGKIAFHSGKLSASLNTLSGPELANDDDHWRHFGDLVIVYKPAPQLSIGGSLDRGRQELPDGTSPQWLGAGAYLRYAINERSAAALRVEQFDDPDSGITGTGQKLREVTLTYEHRPEDNLILKLEARHDRSTAAVFDDSDTQTLVLFGVVVTF